MSNPELPFDESKIDGAFANLEAMIGVGGIHHGLYAAAERDVKSSREKRAHLAVYLKEDDTLILLQADQARRLKATGMYDVALDHLLSEAEKNDANNPDPYAWVESSDTQVVVARSIPTAPYLPPVPVIKFSGVNERDVPVSKQVPVGQFQEGQVIPTPGFTVLDLRRAQAALEAVEHSNLTYILPDLATLSPYKSSSSIDIL